MNNYEFIVDFLDYEDSFSGFFEADTFSEVICGVEELLGLENLHLIGSITVNLLENNINGR